MSDQNWKEHEWTYDRGEIRAAVKIDDSYASIWIQEFDTKCLHLTLVESDPNTAKTLTVLKNGGDVYFWDEDYRFSLKVDDQHDILVEAEYFDGHLRVEIYHPPKELREKAVEFVVRRGSVITAVPQRGGIDNR